jgi:hypothetical protein
MRMRPRPAQPHGSASFGQRVRRANKALLAAVGAGIITLVTSAVVALPHWIAGQISDPPSPITATGEIDRGDARLFDVNCGGAFSVPGKITTPIWLDDSALKKLLVDRKAGQRGNESGSFALQARQGGSPVLLTAIHVEKVSSVPAEPGTDIHIAMKPHADCVLPAAETIEVDIDLDAANPVRSIMAEGQAVDPARFAYTINNQSPVNLYVSATAVAHDVEWKLHLDYSVDGKTGSMVLSPDGGQPYRLYGASAPAKTLHLTFAETQGHWHD